MLTYLLCEYKSFVPFAIRFGPSLSVSKSISQNMCVEDDVVTTRDLVPSFAASSRAGIRSVVKKK
jgi:hypothetical protein